MKMFLLSTAFVFLPPVFPHLGISHLPCTRALSGNDVKRVKCFRRPRGRKMLSDFWKMVNHAEKCGEGNTFMLFIFLQSLVLSFTHVCAAHKSVLRLYIHLVLCIYVVFSTLEEAVVFGLASFLFLFFLSSRHAIPSFAHHYLAV